MKRQVNACRLLTPGPVSIEASVLEAMTCCPSPADAAFISMMEDVRSRLLRVAGMRPAEYAAVLMAGPCAFALEAALTTLIPEESRVLVVCNGARAEAACRMLARADIAFEKLETGFEQAAGAAEIAMLLDERPDITHVAVGICSASSGPQAGSLRPPPLKTGPSSASRRSRASTTRKPTACSPFSTNTLSRSATAARNNRCVRPSSLEKDVTRGGSAGNRPFRISIDSSSAAYLEEDIMKSVVSIRRTQCSVRPRKTIESTWWNLSQCV